MTGRCPSGRATHEPGLASRPGHSVSVPNAANTLTVSGFIQAMQRRFETRADLLGDQALHCAVAALDGWENAFGEPVELTEECAHAIVDSELEHWDAD